MNTASISLDIQPSATTAGATQTSAPARIRNDTMETRVWLDEFLCLECLYNDVENCSPKLRFPDLISACISVICTMPDAATRIFTYLHSQLILRDQETPRRQASIWRPQYDMLLALQKSRMNSHPNPQFKLDHFTTACISLTLALPDAKRRVFEQARKNIADRAAHTLAMSESGPAPFSGGRRP